ncbi:hypothetical protein Prudu_016588 [Prunus dulcis]|uniref:Integrase catalytic domain-containing protein n=1 Tax=Prunus dulcis TaxID=3755 RepID=A0A4Y1RNI9_PRUDU|nr:hypothetical protein Prudu_016588 [Prunus dulcis]
MFQDLATKKLIGEGTPQQNGIAERKNRDLLEKTRALMLQMNVPKRKLFVSRDVRFDEIKPYFNKPSDQNRQGEHLLDFFPLPNPVETSDCVHSIPHHSDSHATNIDNVITGDETEASEAQVVPHDNDTSL